MATNTVAFTLDSATYSALCTAAGRRNGFVGGGEHVTLPIGKWTPTIGDPAWPPTVVNAEGQTVPNPTPQPQITNPVTLQQFTNNLVVALAAKVLADDAVAQADAAVDQQSEEYRIKELETKLGAAESKLAEFQKQAQASIELLIRQRDRALNEQAAIVMAAAPQGQ